MRPNTLFLRLEGPLQAWGVQESKFVVRRTAEAPTKSGVIGILCAALGVDRISATDEWLSILNTLTFGVRIDVPGVRWWDYHTVGAKMQMRIAEGEGKTKPGALLTRREYLCDASFLAALQGEESLIERLHEAMCRPKFPPFLGRKSCPPSRPLVEHPTANYPDVVSALRTVPWKKRLSDDRAPDSLEYIVDWIPSENEPEAPVDAEVWYDVPLCFEPPAHRPRFVVRGREALGRYGRIALDKTPALRGTPAPPRPRADYRNSEYRAIRLKRLEQDNHLCVFCKLPATTVQHVTYRHAGGQERLDELRALCRLCHDAVTMIEYGYNMGLDRIDPSDPQWREQIIRKRDDIVKFRSLETRRRRLDPEEVE